MTPKTETKTLQSLCEVLIENGIPEMRDAMEKLINLAMQLEREPALRAQPYERTPDRQGYANGYKERELATRKVKAITEQLCGFSISSTEVSRMSKMLDEEIGKWRERSRQSNSVPNKRLKGNKNFLILL
jgi:transposase-like protein